uniref:WAT1-related protein n=1 Tax=Cajanus cajan TaxID=3821 RepID=A0A151S6Y5_CAJCA|nr:hypothetical protein KK1_027683 [Cajanus cajan]
MGYVGIGYSSPTLSSSIANLGPAFAFMLAVIFRLTFFYSTTKSSSQAEVMGSIISLTGALIVLTLYKGPSIIKGKAHSHLSLSVQQPISFLRVDILKVFPDEVTLIFFCTRTATVIYTLVALFVVPNASAWKIGLEISLVFIVWSGTFQEVMGNIVSTCVLRLKDPVYVTSFTPFTVVIVVAMGIMFLGDTFHLGRYGLYNFCILFFLIEYK